MIMNILLSYNWLKDFVSTKKSPKELGKLLSLHSMSVERVIPEADLLGDKIVLGEIKKVEPHPNADKLKLAIVNDGTGEFKIVCGAPNIKEGMKVAFAKVGSEVKWHGEGEPIELTLATIRGEQSEGMICDDCEIGLSKYPNPQGVSDYSHLKAKVGTPMRRALKLDDTILDIEITVNRIDAASVVGMARETSAITGEKLNFKEAPEPKPSGEKLPLEITIEDKEKCRGFNGIVLDNVKVGPSPEWLQRRLRAADHTPINNVVDVTNYVMRELGHPLHAFDYDTIEDGHLIIRGAKKGEKLKTLDEKEEKLEPFMVVVSDKKQGQALGGVMGGYDSMINDGTSRVLLEVASWNPQTIRKTAKHLDKFSDASAYFIRGASPQLAEAALKRAVQLLQEIAGARVASPMLSRGYKPYKAKKVSMHLAKAEQMVGAKLKVATVKKQLEALGFKVTAKKDAIECEVPHWRQYDVTIEEDIIEEAARLYGYHNIENDLPSGEMPTPVFDKQLEYEDRLKTLMKGAGYTETYTYSMVSEDMLKLSGKRVKDAVNLLNPLDDDHVYMRTRLLPSVLEVAAENEGLTDEQHLFEISHVYIPQKKNDLPEERSEMAGVIAGSDLETVFRQAKGIVRSVLAELGLNEEEALKAGSGQSLDIVIDADKLGMVGVISPAMARGVGLKSSAAVFELDLQELVKRAKHHVEFTPIPKFPSIELDLSIMVDKKVKWADVLETVGKAGGELLRWVELFDVYDHGDGKKSFGFHLEYRDDEKTLEMKDVEPVQKKIVDRLGKELGAKLR